MPSPPAPGAPSNSTDPGRKDNVTVALVRRIILALVVLFVLIQLAPYGRNNANTPVKA